MNPLTEKQVAILDAIRQSMETRGYPPSLSEVGRAVGLVSEGVVTKQIRFLAFKGYIQPIPGTNKIRVLDPQEVTTHG